MSFHWGLHSVSSLRASPVRSPSVPLLLIPVGSRAGIFSACPMGWQLCVPLLTVAHGKLHPKVGLLVHPLLSWATKEEFPTWASVHVHTPRGWCARLVAGATGGRGFGMSYYHASLPITYQPGRGRTHYVYCKHQFTCWLRIPRATASGPLTHRHKQAGTHTHTHMHPHTQQSNHRHIYPRTTPTPTTLQPPHTHTHRGHDYPAFGFGAAQQQRQHASCAAVGRGLRHCSARGHAGHPRPSMALRGQQPGTRRTEAHPPGAGGTPSAKRRR